MARLEQGYEIVAGGMNGMVTGFQPHEIFWSLKIAEESAKLATLGMVCTCLTRSVCISPYGLGWASLALYPLHPLHRLERSLWPGHGGAAGVRWLAICALSSRQRPTFILADACGHLLRKCLRASWGVY